MRSSAVNAVSLAFLQRTRCPLTPRLISVLRMHTACGTQNAPPAARVRCTHLGTEHPQKREKISGGGGGLPNLSTSISLPSKSPTPPVTAVLEGEKKDLRNANSSEHSRGRSVLHGHGTFSTSKVGGWRQRLAAVGSGWQRLAVGGWWRLAVGGWWSLGAVLNGCP